MATVTAVFVVSGAPSTIERSLESLAQQRKSVDLQVLKMDTRTDPESNESIDKALKELEAESIDCPNMNRAKLWNQALLKAQGEYVSFIDAGHILSESCYADLVNALANDPNLAGSYGRTAIINNEARVRRHPERGKTGLIFNRLVEKKHFFASFPAVLFRKEALEGGFNEIYKSPKAVFLEHALTIANIRPFTFCDRTIATIPNSSDEYSTQEELAKVFVTALYGLEFLSERSEQKLRKRLARQLVTLGKIHYRKSEFDRAGRFISEAVRINPTYFKGRRYQFLNFVKDLVKRSGLG